MKKKVNVSIVLMLFMLVTLLTGILLHLKSHGIVIQPRSVLKVVHWFLGYGMAAMLFIHWAQFKKMLSAMREKFKWFHFVTWLLFVLFLITFLSGTFKLLSPVKIPHLGLWHYSFGIAMGVAAIFHLFRGIPALRRHIRIGK